jgi:hypothetical protein
MVPVSRKSLGQLRDNNLLLADSMPNLHSRTPPRHLILASPHFSYCCGMMAQGISCQQVFAPPPISGVLAMRENLLARQGPSQPPRECETCDPGVGPGRRMNKLPDRGWIEALTDSNLDCGADAHQITTASECSV